MEERPRPILELGDVPARRQLLLGDDVDDAVQVMDALTSGASLRTVGERLPIPLGRQQRGES